MRAYVCFQVLANSFKIKTTVKFKTLMFFGTCRYTFQLPLYIVSTAIEAFIVPLYQLSLWPPQWIQPLSANSVCRSLFVDCCLHILLQCSCTVATLCCHSWKLYHMQYSFNDEFWLYCCMQKPKDTTHFTHIVGDLIVWSMFMCPVCARNSQLLPDRRTYERRCATHLHTTSDFHYDFNWLRDW